MVEEKLKQLETVKKELDHFSKNHKFHMYSK